MYKYLNITRVNSVLNSMMTYEGPIICQLICHNNFYNNLWNCVNWLDEN